MKREKKERGKVRTVKGQGSLEYIMMLAAASIVIVIALAMVVGLKGAVVTHMYINNTNMSMVQAIAHELSSLSSNSV
ncbi:MAG: hypothetical protein QW774_02820 [Candidatus Micrarchaeaceae archaeon]